MKHLLVLFLAGSLLIPIAAQADSIDGTLQLNINGTFKGKVTQGGSVSCSAAVALTPGTSGGMTIGNLSAMLALNSGAQTMKGVGTVATTGKTFKCPVRLSYKFNNYISGQQLIVFYTVSGADQGTFQCSQNGCTFTPPTYKPTGSHQLFTLPSLPPSGTVTTQTVAVQL